MSESSASWYPWFDPSMSTIRWLDEINPNEDNNLVDRGSSSVNPRDAALQTLVRRLRDRILELEHAAVHNTEDLRSTSEFNETLCERISELCAFNCSMCVDLAEARATSVGHLKELRKTRCVLILFVVFVGVVGSIIYPNIN